MTMMASSIGATLSSNLRTPTSTPFRLHSKVPISVDWPQTTAHILLRSTFRCFCSSSPPSVPPPKFDSEEKVVVVGGPMEKKVSFGNNSTYKWCAGIGALGFLETSYLSFVKIFDVDAFCPVGSDGAGGCGDVLNSEYAVVFGIPLPLYGLVAYGLVAWLGTKLLRNNSLSGDSNAKLRIALLGTTTSMATASAYFLYILSTKLASSNCTYCISSAVLSFSLFLLTAKDFGLKEIQKVIGLQLAAVGLVIAALSGSYSFIQPQSSLNDIELEPYKVTITTTSSPFSISLANYLQSIGAKMYGAFWCSHCNEQKQMFGREAMQFIDYVECFPNGVGKGRSIAKECADVGLKGFPTWVINGKLINGEQDLQALAEAAGYTKEDSQPS